MKAVRVEMPDDINEGIEGIDFRTTLIPISDIKLIYIDKDNGDAIKTNGGEWYECKNGGFHIYDIGEGDDWLVTLITSD